MLVDFRCHFFSSQRQQRPKVSADIQQAECFLIYFAANVTYISNKMSSYTPELCRALVDDLDTIFRNAVKNGTINKVLEEEQKGIVSLLYFTD